LRSEDERSQRLAMESERQKQVRMEQAIEMFKSVQSAKRQRETVN
jgi:predicted transcriptional regulator